MARAGLGSVGGYLEPLQGIHLEGGDRRLPGKEKWEGSRLECRQTREEVQLINEGRAACALQH